MPNSCPYSGKNFEFGLRVTSKRPAAQRWPVTVIESGFEECCDSRIFRTQHEFADSNPGSGQPVAGPCPVLKQVVRPLFQYPVSLAER
jgi:hypothetical protein